LAYLENFIANASKIVIPFPARVGIFSDVDLDSLLTTRFSGRGRNHVIGERSSRPPLIWTVSRISGKGAWLSG
jgi:hypothetical protein